MKQFSTLSCKKRYLNPQITVIHYNLGVALLVASNEGLDYEDLFAPKLNLNEEMSINLMSLFDEEIFTQLP